VTTEIGGTSNASSPAQGPKPMDRSRASVSLLRRDEFEMMTIFFLRRCSSLTASTAPS
jgi:hypothetical protein